MFSFHWEWVLSFTLQNLLWLFIFAAVGFFYFEKKNWFWSTVFVVFLTWIWVDFSKLVGWTVLTKEFWALNFIVTMAVLMFAENDSWGKHHLVLINTLRALFVLAFFNLFLA